MEIYSMPALASKFHLRQKVTVALITSKGVSTYGMTALEVTDIVGHQTAWTPKYEASIAKMTKNAQTTKDRNEEQTLYSPALSLVYNNFLINNVKISDADKTAMGIHEMSVSNAPLPKPTTAPRVVITYGESLQHIVNMRNAVTNRLGKPEGVGFMELWYKIGDPAPMGLMDTNLKANIHLSGDPITFLLSQKAMTVYYFARWVTTKGEFGPWSAFFSAVIA